MGFLVIVVGVVEIFVLTFGYIVVATLLKGYLLSVMWRWFMVPILSLPQLSVVQAIGIVLVVAMLTHQNHGYHEDKDQSMAKQVKTIIAPLLELLIAFLVGWVVHHYM